MTWREGVYVLFAAALPRCVYCPHKIATYTQWSFNYCDDCRARALRSADDIPIEEFSYADAVRALESE